MATYDFDFQRYVARRKGAREAEVREGAAYAYAGDLKVLRTLDKLRPVTLAVEAAVKYWRSSARAELLGTAIRASDRQFPRVFALAQRAAAALHVEVPAVYVSPQLPGASGFTFGTGDDPAVVLDAALVEALADAELAFVLGHQLGHVQNGHVPYRTALYFLGHNASAFVRWIVRPATLALGAWARRADVTSDRAGLLAARDLDLSALGLVKLAAAGAVEAGEIEALAEQVRQAAAGPTSATALLARFPELPRRLAALRAFSESAYFRGVLGQEGGYPQETCDARVAEILSQGA
jgi:Zn-dependent protease with chaperone function